ncbi:oligosaccharide flippase family protein [Bacillus sp. CECT 9360]|uniref:oligosaccharide flippase family protein n=1 Tax=Bacillus sp. CECT 9360 TaxID=2845821 RepID=UPI001E5B1285|nr:oligosaccharide flippase family protein [Bacillus sp. CECT 9360]CAH0344876.1 lipid II flippase MurJ [Bacillus sp. CECT 9360]
MSEQKNTFLSNSIITLTRQVVSIVIGLLLLIIIARALGSSGYGKYTLITYLPLMLMTFLNLGLNTSTIYFVSKKEIELKEAFVTSVVSAIVLALVSIVIGFFTIFLLGDSEFSAVDSSLLYLSLCALPFMFLMIFLQTIFQGMQNFKLFNTVLVVQQFGTLLLLILVLFVFQLGLKGALLSFILGYVLSVMYSIVMLFKVYEIEFSLRYFSWKYIKLSISYGLKAHISNIMTFLNYRLGVLLLGVFVSPASVGIYVAAVNLGEKISIFSQSFSQVLLPRIASSNQEEDRNKITAIVSRFIMIFIVCVSLVIFLFSDLIFHVFGEDYRSSAHILNLLLPGLTVLAVEKILSNDLAGRGRPDLNMYVSFVNVALNVVLNLLLIPRYGIQGAAVSSSITYIISFIIKVILYKNVTKQPIKEFLLIKGADITMVKDLAKRLKRKPA